MENYEKALCEVKTYRPVGSDITLINEISNFMFSLFGAYADVEPDALGFLGVMPVCTNKKTREVILCFNPKLAGIITKDPKTFTAKVKPHPALRCMENWFYVGELEKVCSIEKRTVRKHRIVTVNIDGISVPSLEFIKDEKRSTSSVTRYKLEDEFQTLCIRCNLDLVIAAINNHSLADPKFHVDVQPVAKPPKKSEHVIVSKDTPVEYPMTVIVSYDGEDDSYRGYVPELAIGYLKKKLARSKSETGKAMSLQKLAKSEEIGRAHV